MNPKEITVTPNVSTAETVKQSLVIVGKEPRTKRDALRRLIRSEDVENAIVFCNRKRDVDILNRSLQKHGFNSAALHGDMSQPARLETLQAFKDDETQFLVASDVAARGLDLPRVSHVFNFDVPSHAEDYVHRIGRTGRAGRDGRAHMIATPDDAAFLDAVTNFIGNDIEQINVEGTVSVEMDDIRSKRSRGNRRTQKETVKKGAAKKNVAQSTDINDGATLTPTPRARTPKKSRPRKPNKNNSSEKSSEETVVGMGPHVPAFMLKSVRASSE